MISDSGAPVRCARRHSISSNWQHTALLIGSATLLLCMGLLWLTWLLVRELRLRLLAQRTRVQTHRPLGGRFSNALLFGALANQV